MVVVRLAGEAWFAGGEVERRTSVGRLLAGSLRAAIGVGEGGERVSEVCWLQIEQELGRRGPVPRDLRLPDAAELRSIPSTKALRG